VVLCIAHLLHVYIHVYVLLAVPTVLRTVLLCIAHTPYVAAQQDILLLSMLDRMLRISRYAGRPTDPAYAYAHAVYTLYALYVGTYT
jgi:hypothetical protein